MEMVPIREHVDRRLDDLREHIDGQFSDVKWEVRSLKRHSHRELVSWRAALLIGISLAGAVSGYVVAFL